MFLVSSPKTVVMRQRYSSTEWVSACSSKARIGVFILAILGLCFLGGCNTTPEGKLTWGFQGFGVSSAYGQKKFNTKQVANQKPIKKVRKKAQHSMANDIELREAAQNLDLAGVKSVLEKGANPNAASSHGVKITPIYAVTIGLTGYRGNEGRRKAWEVAKSLFENGAKLGPHDRTVLFLPIAAGHIALVSLLLDHGASPTRKIEGYTPTEIALKYSQDDVYRLLVSRGGIPVSPHSHAQLALAEAASNHDIPAMQAAIKNGADVNWADPNGAIALIAALRLGIYRQFHAESVRWLLDSGADPNMRGWSGLSDTEGIPLHVFIAMSRYDRRLSSERKRLLQETFHRLIKAGAKVSGMDSRDRTPLHLAAKSDNLVLADMLIREGCRIMPKDTAGKSPLDYAESASMIRLLKNHGATES